MALHRRRRKPVGDDEDDVVVAGSECGQAGGVEPPPEVGQAVAKRAIQLHATALILVTCRPGKPQPTNRDMELTACILRAATVLSVTVHDHWLYSANKTASLRRMGLL